MRKVPCWIEYMNTWYPMLVAVFTKDYRTLRKCSLLGGNASPEMGLETGKP